jgi:hypothetical protein
MDDMAGVAMNAPTDNQYSGGRTATTITIQDERFNCNGIVVNVTPDQTQRWINLKAFLQWILV